jgi:hypothetical protein
VVANLSIFMGLVRSFKPNRLSTRFIFKLVISADAVNVRKLPSV